MAAVFPDISSTYNRSTFLHHINESMANDSSHNQAMNPSSENDELSRIFEDTLNEYPDILKYISEFQVKLNKDVAINWNLAIQRSVANQKKSNKSSNDKRGNKSKNSKSKSKPSIIVFKKKKLNNLNVNKGVNIYEHNLSKPDIDTYDKTKSKVSCLRCRKFKKKCTRSLPECSNCVSSDELCIYLPRKMKKSKKDLNKPIEEKDECSHDHDDSKSMVRKDSTSSNRTDTSSFAGLPINHASMIQSPYALPSIHRVLSPSLIPELDSMKHNRTLQSQHYNGNSYDNFYRPVHVNSRAVQQSGCNKPSNFGSPVITQDSYPSPNQVQSNFSYTKKHLSDFDKILN